VSVQAGTVPQDDRRHGPPRRQRRRHGREQQRLPNGGADRANVRPTVDGARLNLPYTLLFLSTDGAGDGTLRAAEFAANLPERENATP
jgi:hypothetical protein